MHNTREIDVENTGRLQALREKHSILEAQISNEQSRPSASHVLIKQLKIEKLRLKEEIVHELERA